MKPNRVTSWHSLGFLNVTVVFLVLTGFMFPADILVMKALDKDGNKIFTLEDKLALMHKVDSDVLSRIATAMVQAINPEVVKKN